MAKTIATIGGVALAPGVSKNRRLYTPDHVKNAVARAQKRIEAGDRPMVMLTHHGAGDDSRQIAASLTSVGLDEAGRARYTAAITDTEAGRDIASLVDTSDGAPPHLDGVSIRGAWLGTVRKVRGPDGGPVETADDLEWDGLDFTRSPGVDDANIDTFAWADRLGRTETTERILITESVQEARVTISEETAPGLDEAADAKTPAPPGTVYADPGYLKDKKKRYPLNSPSRIRAAWSYISQKANAAQYSDNQLKRIKGKIKAAMGRIGATIADEGYVVWPAEQVTETVLAEYCDGSGTNGSFSVCASNGPLSISVSSYCINPADLDLILRAAADAACKAFAAMDPDMDGDIDVPGADSEDTDHDAGESAPPEQVTETSPPDTAPKPVAEPQEDKEVPVVTDTATAVEASPAAATDPKVIAEAVDAALARAEADRKARKAAKKAARPAESAPAAKATETDDERIARIVEERAAARIRAEIPAPVAETEDERISRLVEARVTAEKQRLVAEGQVAPGRKGLSPSGAVDEHTARVTPDGGEMPPAPPGKSWDEMHKWSTEDLNQYAGPGLADYVFGGRAGSIG